MLRIPFDPTEVEEAVEYPGFLGVMVKRYKTPISPKENYALVFGHKMPLWIPVSGDTLSLTPRIDPDNIARGSCSEANPLAPEELIGGRDKFGVEWVYIPMVKGSMVRPGNPILRDVNDWNTVINFPDVEAWDWEKSKASNAEYVKTDRFLSITILTGFFERLISFMDFENAAISMIDEDQKDAIHKLFSALADLYIKMVEKYIYCYGIDQLCLHDDWGSQRAPFFSLSTAREMIVPYIKRVSDFCHSRGVYFSIHSCGKNELLVPAYIEAGCDSWNGQDVNDKELLYEMYGDKIILGIRPDILTVPNKLIDAEETIKTARRFVDKYCENYDKKPVFVESFGISSEFCDSIYTESRKVFYEIH